MEKIKAVMKKNKNTTEKFPSLGPLGYYVRNSENTLAYANNQPIRILLHQRSETDGDFWIVVAGPIIMTNGLEWVALPETPDAVHKSVFGFSFAEEALEAVKKWQFSFN